MDFVNTKDSPQRLKPGLTMIKQGVTKNHQALLLMLTSKRK